MWFCVFWVLGMLLQWKNLTHPWVSGFLGLYIDYYNEDWVRKSLNIGCPEFSESHTGENIWKLTRSILDEWGILFNPCWVKRFSREHEKSPQYWQFGDIDCWNQLFDTPFSPTLLKRKSSESPIPSIDCTICVFFGYFRSNKPEGGRTIARTNLTKNEFLLALLWLHPCMSCCVMPLELEHVVQPE